jgi:hypothetical protein
LELNRPDDVNAHLALALIENGWLANRLEINLVSSRYSHSNTMNHAGWEMVHPTEDHVLDHGVFAGTNVQHLFDTLGMGYFEDVAIDILASTRDYADDIYRQLRDEYERLCSEEVIAELCEANDYRFDEQGNLI